MPPPLSQTIFLRDCFLLLLFQFVSARLTFVDLHSTSEPDNLPLKLYSSSPFLPCAFCVDLSLSILNHFYWSPIWVQSELQTQTQIYSSLLAPTCCLCPPCPNFLHSWKARTASRPPWIQRCSTCTIRFNHSITIIKREYRRVTLGWNWNNKCRVTLGSNWNNMCRVFLGFFQANLCQFPMTMISG